MYNSGQYGQAQQGQWQAQPGHQGVAPAGMSPQHQAVPVASPMSAEAAAQFRDYGYGATHQRGGQSNPTHGHRSNQAGHGPHRHTNMHNANPNFRNAASTQAQPMSMQVSGPGMNSPHSGGYQAHGVGQHQMVSATPMSANIPYAPGPGHSPGLNQPHFAPNSGSNGPPAKRPRYEAAPQGMLGHVQGPHTQPMHQGNPPLPPGPPPATTSYGQGPGQPYYSSPQQPPGQHAMYTGPYQDQAQGFHQPQQAFYPQQPVMHQAAAPMSHIPMGPASHQHSQPPPPLAVAPMKVTNRNQSHHSNSGQPPPPPPASSAPPPPPPPPIPTGPRAAGTIKLSPKGAATLPPNPTGIASLPLNPVTGAAVAPPSLSTNSTTKADRETKSIPHGPAAKTRPREQDFSDSKPGPFGNVKPPTGPANQRGGFGGRGRGGPGHGRGGFDRGRNVSGRSNYSNDRFDGRSTATSHSDNHSQTRSGGKRPFSSTGSGNSASNSREGHVKQRVDGGASTHGHTSKQPGGYSIGRTLSSNQVSQDKAFRGAKDGSKQDGPTGKNNQLIEADTSSKGASSKRTLTDFRIESLEIVELGWMWKAGPGVPLDETTHEALAVSEAVHSNGVKSEPGEQEESPSKDEASNTTGIEDASVAMQRKDSRKEKRKHSDEEDDGDSYGPRQGTDYENKGEQSSTNRGKKAKNESSSPTIPHSTVPEICDQDKCDKDVNADDEETTDQAKQLDSADIESAADKFQSTCNSTSDENDQPVKVENAQDDEISASKPNSELGTNGVEDGLPPGEDQREAAETGREMVGSEVEDVKSNGDQKTGEERNGTAHGDNASKVELAMSKSSDSVSAPTEPSNNQSKKHRENSRLRLYFFSPVTLDQPKEKKKAGSGVPAKSKRGGKKSKASESKDTSGSKATSVEPSPQEQQILEAQNVDDDEEDLDGEPVGDTAAHPSADALKEAQTNGSTGTDMDPTEEAADSKDRVDLGGDSAEQKADENAHNSEDLPGGDQSVEGALGDLSQPKPDRLSISYARNTRRLVIDAEAVEDLCVYRVEAKVEVRVRLTPFESGAVENGLRAYRGVFIEVSKGDNQFTEISKTALEQAWPEDTASAPAHPDQRPHVDGMDQLLPPLHQLANTEKVEEHDAAVPEGSSAAETQSDRSHYITVVARLDRANPLTEAKWVRTGNADDWIMSITGGAGVTSDPKGETTSKMSAWKGKIRVVDPDAPPTFQHALENWLSSANSRSGFEEARYRFVSAHFQDVKNVMEVLLRLIRGVADRSSAGSAHSTGSHSHHQSSVLAAQAISAEAPYPEQQTPVSLATFQLFKLGVEAAVEAGVPKADIDRRIGEIVRTLPYSLIFKSLDSIYLDYKKSKKPDK